jgi:hypothetical protein
MDEIKNEKCEHINFEREGLWDGVSKEGKPIGGPEILCLDCRQKVCLTWEEFKSVRRNESR